MRVLYFQHGRMHFILWEQDTQAKSVIRVTAVEPPLLPPLILELCSLLATHRHTEFSDSVCVLHPRTQHLILTEHIPTHSLLFLGGIVCYRTRGSQFSSWPCEEMVASWQVTVLCGLPHLCESNVCLGTGQERQRHSLIKHLLSLPLRPTTGLPSTAGDQCSQFLTKWPIVPHP